MDYVIVKLTMTYTLAGKIRNGKIIPEKKIPYKEGKVQIKIFVFPKSPPHSSYFGKLRGIFGDAVHYQKKIRSEWK